MQLTVESTSSLRFDDGTPVRAASAIAPFGDGWLVVQDDATHAAWWRGDTVTPVRVVDAVDGLEEFSSAAGTKHLKPDFEAACAITSGSVLLLGSGSTDARMRASLVTPESFAVADLTPVYHRVAEAIGIPVTRLNLEGACRDGDMLHWFQRGNAAAGTPTARVSVSLPALLSAFTGDAGDIKVTDTRRFDLGTVDGVALAVTDAVTLPGGRVLVSAAAEDAPNAIDDGPVVASALALLDGERVLDVAEIPVGPSGPYKVEGLAVAAEVPGGVRLHAVVDADDTSVASSRLALQVLVTPRP
ncbi:hypothetical protein AMIS_35590 [Actinoplanes missouriensis 431]|uniref:Uncharacterized protein n=1 Tax=Actinoplanes missouriensis (strain ATCC 14538 / DSM 43046 / CBS 188.64 / JCM 3121 / NBRC 102363 / NCIMB 12654 / NRRL B-3342 / UNCC 431) TaxID=512565 RepID=I0H6Z2_ACTM4|nr:hypothetical protein AMIS_35590 [Actinoplanes missouriensis 431]